MNHITPTVQWRMQSLINQIRELGDRNRSPFKTGPLLKKQKRKRKSWGAMGTFISAIRANARQNHKKAGRSRMCGPQS